MTLNRWARMGLVFAITSTMAFWAYSQAPATAPTTQPAQKSVGETTDAGVAAPTAQAQADAGPASAPSAAKAEAPQEAAQTEKKDGDKKEKYDWKGSSAETTARNFLKLLSAKKYADAYASGSGLLKKSRTPEQFQAHIEASGLHNATNYDLTNGVPAKDGYRISGEATTADGNIPFYLNLLGDEALRAEGTKRDWSNDTVWGVLDVQANPSIMSRLSSGTLNGLDYFILLSALILLGALFFMIMRYVLGLRGSPYELYLMFFTKLTEYSAYGAASYCFVLYLDKDVGLGTSGATAYYTVFSLTMTVVVMVVGAVCDTIGIKKSLLIGAVMLMTARFFMPLTTDIVLTSLLGFLPFALGVAITGPVLKVGIKKFTTIQGATLGFGLFYTLMNVGFAIGGWMFDAIRNVYGDGGSTTLPIFGIEISTYQVILGVGFFINIPDLIAVLLMREGAEMTEAGARVVPPVKPDTAEVDRLLADTKTERVAAMTKEIIRGGIITGIVVAIAFGINAAGLNPGKWGWASVVFVGLMGSFMLVYGVLSYLGLFNPGFNRIMHTVRSAAEETGRRLADNFQERTFWVYLFMLAILVFVRLTFFIFHVMFPTYGIRVFGEGAMVGSIFGVLNPVMIVFLVPLISVLTVKIRSFTMILVGTLVSAGAVFLCFIPEAMSLDLVNSAFGQLIFDYWLEVPVGQRDPFYISLIIFIIVFTIGEAIWSPRLMQFSAEIAPRGKEGSYIALAILPYFVGKALAGGMSGGLLENYVPEGALTYPDHQMVWMWIGGMAMLSPIGMVIFRKMFRKVEDAAVEEAKQIALEAQEDIEEQG